jgi:hypothetical protein
MSNFQVKTHYSDLPAPPLPLWGVTLYYFSRMCIFECIPPQTFERFSFVHIMLKYNLGKILEKKIFHFILQSGRLEYIYGNKCSVPMF